MNSTDFLLPWGRSVNLRVREGESRVCKSFGVLLSTINFGTYVGIMKKSKARPDKSGILQNPPERGIIVRRKFIST